MRLKMKHASHKYDINGPTYDIPIYYHCTNLVTFTGEILNGKFHFCAVYRRITFLIQILYILKKTRLKR